MCCLAKLRDGPVKFKMISITEGKCVVRQKQTNNKAVYNGQASQSILSTNELRKNKDSVNNFVVTSSSTSSNIIKDTV